MMQCFSLGERRCCSPALLQNFSAHQTTKCCLRQVVIENKRQLCIAKLAADKREPWLWWQFAAGYSEHCTMANGKFGDAACAEVQTRALNLDPGAVSTCMGNSEADTEHPQLQVRPVHGRIMSVVAEAPSPRRYSASDCAPDLWADCMLTWPLSEMTRMHAASSLHPSACLLSSSLVCLGKQNLPAWAPCLHCPITQHWQLS